MLHALSSQSLTAGPSQRTCRNPGRSVAVYVTTATHRRNTTQPTRSVRSHGVWLTGCQGTVSATMQSQHMHMPCHSVATARVVPAPSVPWLYCVCAIVCRPVRARAIGSFRTHDDDDTAFPQKRGEVLPYEAHHAPCTGACPPDGTRPDAIPPAPASPVSPELRPSTHLSSCPTCPRLTRGHAGRCDPM